MIQFLGMYVSDSIAGVESASFAGLNTQYLGDHIPGVESEGRCHETSNGTGGGGGVEARMLKCRRYQQYFCF